MILEPALKSLLIGERWYRVVHCWFLMSKVGIGQLHKEQEPWEVCSYHCNLVESDILNTMSHYNVGVASFLSPSI